MDRCFRGKPKKADARDPDLCVITCALTGVLANRSHAAAIPYTPVEIAEEARRAYEAGAAVVHIHARNDDGTPTLSPDIFAAIKREVTRRCPVLLNFSTGSLDDDVSAQCRYLSESKPELAALNMGSMNYAKYSARRKRFDFDLLFRNSYSKIIELLRCMNAHGVKPELECFDTGHTHGLAPLLDMGLLEPPLQLSFIVGVLGGAPAELETLQLQLKLVPPASQWECIAISHGHWRMLAASAVMGGNVRTGLEDHLYLPDGKMAQSNGEMVEVAARLVHDVGRRPATVEETRTILSLEAANEHA